MKTAIPHLRCPQCHMEPAACWCAPTICGDSGGRKVTPFSWTDFKPSAALSIVARHRLEYVDNRERKARARDATDQGG